MAVQAEQAKEAAKACCSNPKKLITYLWFTILFFAFLYSLGAIVMAVNNNGGGISDNKSLGFAGVWMMFLIIALSAGGTMVMRKYQTPIAVGFFIGVVVMMSFNMFSMFVLFAGAAHDARNDPENGDVHSDEAAAAFAFFMFLLYSIFSAVLVKHRAVIIKDNATASNDSGLPEKMAPAQGNSAPTTLTSAPAPVTAAPVASAATSKDLESQNPPPVSV